MRYDIPLGGQRYACCPAAVALLYHKWGYRNVRLAPGQKRPAMDYVAGNPAVTEQTEADIMSMFHDEAPFDGGRWNIGWWLSDEQLFIDLDRDHAGGKDGLESLRGYEAERGGLQPTWVVHTPGGLHLPYRDPHRLLEEAGLVTNVTGCHVTGIDYRAPGKGIEIVPGSHIDGRGDYLWDEERNPWEMPCGVVDEGVVEFVRWLGGQVRPTGSAASAGKAVARSADSGTSIVIGDDDIVPVGSRNDALFRTLCSARARGADDDEVERLAHDLNENRLEEPLDASEIAMVVASACRYEQGVDYTAMADRLLRGPVSANSSYAPVIVKRR